MGKVEEGTGGINDDGRRLDLGGEHTGQYTDDVLQNCISETYMTLLPNVTPVNSILFLKKLIFFFNMIITANGWLWL